MKKFLILLILLTNCTEPPITEPPKTTSDIIIQRIDEAGIEIYDFEYNSWLGEPNEKIGDKYDSDWFLYSERVHFTIDEVAPKGGQFFICETRTECDEIFAHYDNLKSLAGPYIFRSKDGKLVAQLNSTLSLETGVKFQSIFKEAENLIVTER